MRRNCLQRNLTACTAPADCGLLSTAGGLLFAGDTNSNVVALDPATGNPLWHAGLHTPLTNGPITYELDGAQYMVVGAGDTLYAFAIR